MPSKGGLCLLISLAVFIIFFTDVGLGAAKAGGFLDDVGEMLTLLTATILFVIGILAREADATKKNHQGREMT